MAETVTAACKLPNGIFIELGQKTEKVGEGRDAQQVVVQAGQTIKLNGTNSPTPSIGGYGFTAGIDKELFLDWMERYKDFPPVKNGFIFWDDDGRSARARARDMAGEPNGLEFLDPNDPLGDGTITPEEETKKTLEKNKAEAGGKGGKASPDTE